MDSLLKEYPKLGEDVARLIMDYKHQMDLYERVQKINMDIISKPCEIEFLICDGKQATFINHLTTNSELHRIIARNTKLRMTMKHIYNMRETEEPVFDELDDLSLVDKLYVIDINTDQYVRTDIPYYIQCNKWLLHVGVKRGDREVPEYNYFSLDLEPNLSSAAEMLMQIDSILAVLE